MPTAVDSATVGGARRLFLPASCLPRTACRAAIVGRARRAALRALFVATPAGGTCSGGKCCRWRGVTDRLWHKAGRAAAQGSASGSGALHKRGYRRRRGLCAPDAYDRMRLQDDAMAAPAKLACGLATSYAGVGSNPAPTPPPSRQDAAAGHPARDGPDAVYSRGAAAASSTSPARGGEGGDLTSYYRIAAFRN